MTVAAPAFVMNDPRLEFDAATHCYTLGGEVLPSVTQLLGVIGLADFSAPWFTDEVRDRGSFVHAAIMLDNEGDLDEASLDPELVPYVAGWRAYRRDTSCEIEFWEQRVCDPTAGVAGTLDGIVRITEPNGRRRRKLIDIKRGVYPSAAIQTAAYQDMAYSLYDHPVVLERELVALPGDGSYRVHSLTDPMDRSTWQAAIRIFQWRKAHGLNR